MGHSVVYKILKTHIVEGHLDKGESIRISVDQTLWNDITGIVAGQVLESIDNCRIENDLSVVYADHNTLVTSPDNSNDHLYLKLISQKYGLHYSKPGNGICHTLHCQRFARPGKVLIGADSHTPTSGALGMIAIGSGGLTVAKSMLGEGFRFSRPKVLNVILEGQLSDGVSAKDISFEMLRRLTVKGGKGYIIEFGGEGIRNLSITERQTITNMCTELGALTGIFPSDLVTRQFMEAQDREEEWIELLPDEDATYDKVIRIDLGRLKPMVAMPHMPDLVSEVSNLKNMAVDSVFIGSCTNSSYSDIARAAAILKGRKVHSNVDLTIAPGSRQTLLQLTRDGVIGDLVDAGARILECACGPCIGIGQVPHDRGVSLRTSNRNFKGRSGNEDASLYLAGPEIAAASAVTGRISQASEIMDVSMLAACVEPGEYIVDDSQIIPPGQKDGDDIALVKGGNISEMPVKEKLKDRIDAGTLIKVEDNITTDDILPSGSNILGLIANIPELAKYTFHFKDPGFVERAADLGRSVIIAGENYGQGSSREHAALLPMYLGVEAVVAKSYSRIHKENLINHGLLPLVFKNGEDYDKIEVMDRLTIENVLEQVESGSVTIKNVSRDMEFEAVLDVSDYDLKVLRCGGILNYLGGRIK